MERVKKAHRHKLIRLMQKGLYAAHPNGMLQLYGFDVGQGESLLLITSTGNAYLIDSNLYSRKQCQRTFLTHQGSWSVRMLKS